MPVLLFFQNDENWSVIGTTGISGVFEGQYRAVKYSHIVELDGFEAAQEEKTRKSTLSTLKVITREEVFEFKTTPGNEFFSFWSICQMLQRMLAEKE